MNKLYLHKKNNYAITTTKDKIIFDLDKVNKNYKYKSNILKKYPDILEIKGNRYDGFQCKAFCFDFPVEKVIINKEYFTNILSHLMNFYKTTSLEITNIAKEIKIIDNLGLNKLNNITIPFTINEFSNKYINNNQIKTLTIYNDNEDLTINLDECLLNKKVDIYIRNYDNKLNINITSSNIDIEYIVYLENNKLTSTKKYNKYEINASNDDREELNLIELKKIYNDITFNGKFYYVRKVIMEKSDIYLLTKDIFNNLNLKEINIIDDNDMSLIPRNINITCNREKNEYFNKIEMVNNNILIHTNQNLNINKYIIINEDLSLIKIERIIFIDVILDYNANKFKYENYTLIIPFSKSLRDNVFKSKIVKKIINNSHEIFVKKNDKKCKVEGLKFSSDEFDTKKESDFNKHYDQENFKIYKPLKKYKTISRNDHLPGPKF